MNVADVALGRMLGKKFGELGSSQWIAYRKSILRRQVMTNSKLNIALKRRISFKEKREEKLSRLKQKRLTCKFLDNPQADEMIREQFAKLTNSNESDINPLISLTKQNLAAHFYSFGHSKSLLLESVADYLIGVAPKVTFSSFHKFLVEGLLSSSVEVQRQICFSIYSRFSHKLSLSQIYDYIEDPICQIVIEDLLAMHKALTEPSSQLKSHHTQPFKYTTFMEERKSYPFLFIEETQSDPSEYSADEKEVRSIMNKKDACMTFKEFLTVSFQDDVPALLLLMIQLVCGRDLLDYYTEVINVKQFRYTLIKRNERSEYFVDRRAPRVMEEAIRRESKHLVKKIRSVKPGASRAVIEASIRLFQALRNAGQPTKHVTKESFVENSVFAGMKARNCCLGRS